MPQLASAAGSGLDRGDALVHGRVMAELDDVRKLIVRLTPDLVCDDCVAARLLLSSRHNANRISRELAGRDGFERRRDLCSLCGGDKLVIRHR